MSKRYNAVLMWVCFLVFVLVAICSADDVDTKVTAIKTGISTVNGMIFNLVRGTLSVLLFGTILWELIQGYAQKNLASKWPVIIGAAVFMIGVNIFPIAYDAMMGGKNSDTSQREDWVDK